MRNNLLGTLVSLLCLAPMIGCGDDSGSKSDSAVAHDMAVATPDMTAAAGTTCLGILTCAAGAASTAGLEACIQAGSTAAQGLFGAIQTCAYTVCLSDTADGGAGDGGAAACSSATDVSSGCLSCVTAAGQSTSCSTEFTACEQN